VTRLESRELVTRRLDPINGRYVVCELTESGSQLLRTGSYEHLGQLRRLMFDALTETQVQQLTEICTALGHTLAAEARRGDQA
jgi:DNA-binding MarR family transcriptional regulator